MEKLILFLKKRVHKNAEVISIKEEKKEEKKGNKGKEETKKKEDEKKSSGESTKEKLGEGKSSGETTKVIEIHHGHTQDEIQIKDKNVPYIIHYVYAPQLFSDENPNSCFIL